MDALYLTIIGLTLVILAAVIATRLCNNRPHCFGSSRARPACRGCDERAECMGPPDNLRVRWNGQVTIRERSNIIGYLNRRAELCKK